MPVAFQAFLSYFDIVFDCNGDETVYFSTGPEAVPTHWQQTVFFLEEPIDVKPGVLSAVKAPPAGTRRAAAGTHLHALASAGTVVAGRVRCARTEDNDRNLVVHLTYSVQPLDGAAGPEHSQSYIV